MATLRKTTEAQAPLIASFEFDVADGDQMVATDGVLSDFITNGKAFDVLTLPFGSTVVGGEVVVKTASDVVTTHTLSVGDSASATRYANAVNLKSAARTALTLTGFETTSSPLRLTVAATGGGGTVGNVRVNVMFIINNRSHENLKTT